MTNWRPRGKPDQSDHQRPVLAARHAGALELLHQPGRERVGVEAEVARVGGAVERGLVEVAWQLGERHAAHLEQLEGDAGADRVARHARAVVLEGADAREGALERVVELGEGRAVAGDHRIDREPADRLQGAARLAERVAAGPSPRRTGCRSRRARARRPRSGCGARGCSRRARPCRGRGRPPPAIRARRRRSAPPPRACRHGGSARRPVPPRSGAGPPRPTPRPRAPCPRAR